MGFEVKLPSGLVVALFLPAGIEIAVHRGNLGIAVEIHRLKSVPPKPRFDRE